MEAIRKQASKLREQFAKQQQAVFKQFSGRFGHDFARADDTELQCHQKLQMLYNSTRTATHFQKDIDRAVEGFISVSSKQMEIVTKLAEDCCKYGNEHQNSGFALARASWDFGTSHHLMEKERENLLKTLGDQVIHSFDAQTDGELSLSIGDHVVVRQVAPNGWSEGECTGKAGWFPSAYVVRRD